MTSIITRRNLLGGLLSAMAAPWIVRASSLMPVSSRALVPFDPTDIFETMARQMAKTIICGNPDCEPVLFTGFSPYFHVITPDKLYRLDV